MPSIYYLIIDLPLASFKDLNVLDQSKVHLIMFTQQGWPPRHRIKKDILLFWPAREELSTHKDLLLYGSRIVISKSMHEETLQKIHRGYQGTERGVS